MTEQHQEPSADAPQDSPTSASADAGEEQVIVVGPDGQPIGTIAASALPAMTQVSGSQATGSTRTVVGT